MSIMEALFNGRIIPWERRFNMTEKRREIEDRIEEEKQYLMSKLPPEDGKRIEQLEDLYTRSAHCEEIDNYTYGFALGALLMQEVMEQKDTMIIE